MSSRSKLQKIQVVDADQLDSGNVSESLDEGTLGVEDYQRTSSLNVSSVSHLSLAGSELLRFHDSLDIGGSVQSLEESLSLGSLVDVVNSLVVNNEGDLSDGGDSVSSGHDESGDGRSSDGRSQSKTLLSDVDLSVPSSPGLGGGEHSASSAHVTESSLSSSVGSSSRNSRNTGNSSTSSP